MSDELKPCPFCGERLVLARGGDGYTHNRRVKRAKECLVSWMVVRRQHCAAWNTRAAAPDLLEAARDGLEALEHIAAGNYPDEPDFAAKAQQKADRIKAVLEKVEG